MNITAKLISAKRVTYPFGECIVGQVFGDSKGRFEAGETIRTSPIVHVDGDIVSTRNSIYEVHWAETV